MTKQTKTSQFTIVDKLKCSLDFSQSSPQPVTSSFPLLHLSPSEFHRSVSSSIHSFSPRFPSCYVLSLTVGPDIFFLGAAEAGGLGFGADAGFLALGCRDLSSRISQYLLHWCKALNWSMNEVAQFPLNPLYLRREQSLTLASAVLHGSQQRKETYPFLQVAIPTSVSLIPTPETHS